MQDEYDLNEEVIEELSGKLRNLIGEDKLESLEYYEKELQVGIKTLKEAYNIKEYEHAKNIKGGIDILIEKAEKTARLNGIISNPKLEKLIKYGIKMDRETLEKLVKEIDSRLEFKEYVDEGNYGIILKVIDQGNIYKMKINLVNEVEGRSDTLEREYKTLEDLASKTDISSKPIKLYDNVRCAWYNIKGKYAYLAEFIEGESLSEAGKQSEISLLNALNELIYKVHDAGYRFSDEADLKPDNIILGKDGKLYLIDIMFLVPLKEKILGMTKRERFMRDSIIRRCT